jgi:hypothetical protein
MGKNLCRIDNRTKPQISLTEIIEHIPRVICFSVEKFVSRL